MGVIRFFSFFDIRTVNLFKNETYEPVPIFQVPRKRVYQAVNFLELHNAIKLYITCVNLEFRKPQLSLHSYTLILNRLKFRVTFKLLRKLRRKHSGFSLFKLIGQYARIELSLLWLAVAAGPITGRYSLFPGIKNLRAVLAVVAFAARFMKNMGFHVAVNQFGIRFFVDRIGAGLLSSSIIPRWNGVRVAPQAGPIISGFCFVTEPVGTKWFLAVLPVNPGEPDFKNLFVNAGIANINGTDNPAVPFVYVLLGNRDLFAEHKGRGELFGLGAEVLVAFRGVYPVEPYFELFFVLEDGDRVSIGYADHLSGNGL